MLSPAMRIAVLVWQRHYRIARWRYWAVLILGLCFGMVSLLTSLYTGLFDGEAFDRQFVAGMTLVAINAILIASSLIGLLRWRIDRIRARSGLVVPHFGESAGAKGRGTDVQAAIIDALQENLSDDELRRVHKISAVIDLEDRKQAARLLKRLDAQGVVHGRAVDRPGGGWTVHARLARPAIKRISHYDWHTLDRTPGRMPWRAWFSPLPSTHDVSDQEFPLDLTRDLGALVRVLAGASNLSSGASEAETALREALEASPESRSAVMDQVRLELAMAIFVQGRPEDALGILRERISAGDASPELVRAFDFLAGAYRVQIRAEVGDTGELDHEEAEIEAEIEAEEFEEIEELAPDKRRQAERARELAKEADEMMETAFDDSDEAANEGEGSFEADWRQMREEYKSLPVEAIAALEVAAKDKRDPCRDVTLYNLITDLLSAALEAETLVDSEALRQRAWARLDELIATSRYYRGTWYVKRLRGLRAWLELQAIIARRPGPSSEAKAASAEAAKWYSRAIRARPKMVIERYEEMGLLRRYRLRSRRSPILDANAFDGHRWAGHRLRAAYHEIRFRQRRASLLRQGFRDLRKGYLQAAHYKVERSIVGRHKPDEGRRDAVENAAMAVKARIEEMSREGQVADEDALLEEMIAAESEGEGVVR